MRRGLWDLYEGVGVPTLYVGLQTTLRGFGRSILDNTAVFALKVAQNSRKGLHDLLIKLRNDKAHQ